MKRHPLLFFAITCAFAMTRCQATTEESRTPGGTESTTPASQGTRSLPPVFTPTADGFASPVPEPTTTSALDQPPGPIPLLIPGTPITIRELKMFDRQR